MHYDLDLVTAWIIFIVVSLLSGAGMYFLGGPPLMGFSFGILAVMMYTILGD